MAYKRTRRMSSMRCMCIAFRVSKNRAEYLCTSAQVGFATELLPRPRLPLCRNLPGNSCCEHPRPFFYVVAFRGGCALLVVEYG